MQLNCWVSTCRTDSNVSYLLQLFCTFFDTLISDDHLVGVAIARNAPDAPDVASAFILNLLTKVVVQKWNIQDTPFRMPHDVTVDLQRSVYISEIDAQTTNKVLRFDLKQVTSSKQRKSDLKMPLYLKLLVLSGSFLIVMTIGAIYLRFKFNKRQKHDISVAFKQLFSNPQDEGFDRLALDEELNERLMSDNSESEVEEFSSTNYSRKS